MKLQLEILEHRCTLSLDGHHNELVPRLTELIIREPDFYDLLIRVMKGIEDMKTKKPELYNKIKNHDS